MREKNNCTDEWRAPGAFPIYDIRVSDWNVENFGPTKVHDAARVTAIAEIVRQYDLVAIQEISDVHNHVPTLFLAVINGLRGPEPNSGAAAARVIAKPARPQRDLNGCRQALCAH